MKLTKSEYLEHYGTPRRSGRYPWGTSGWGKGDDDETKYKRNKTFLDHIKELEADGHDAKTIAKLFDMSTTELRAQKSIAVNENRQADISQAVSLKQKGWGNTAIGERMGIGESTVRSYLKAYESGQQDILTKTADMLRQQVADKKYLDVGSGVEIGLGISEERLRTAISMLKREGYEVHSLKIQQLGTGKDTNYKVLVGPETTYSELSKNRYEVKLIDAHTEDYGETWITTKPPLSISSDRIQIRYGEDGGGEADGVIYVRPGVKDLSMGGASYAQVRIAVDGTHYLKGMAIPKSDLPPGVDVQYNTPKSDTGNPKDVMKKLNLEDEANPFGAYIKRQITEKDSNGNDVVVSALNILHEEGDWSDWSRIISSQVLSKQEPKVAKTQLDMTYEKALQDYEEISSLTNPTLKRKLLIEFGDKMDRSAVTLEAAAMPNQAYHVIMPISSLPDSRVYAPNYKDGDRLALIRFPHGGTFEIPDLIVDNSNKEAKKLLGDTKDVIGINHRVAERMSGADFDGDSVVVIPNNHGLIKSTPALEGLKNFDPKLEYPKYEGMKVMSEGAIQQQMGSITNLIADMTIKGAPPSEITRAVRHSMVVIDAHKHELNYKQSEKDNGIHALRKRYQTNPETGKSGAATLITRAKSPVYLPPRKERTVAKGGPIDPKTGKRMYEPAPGGPITKSTKLGEIDDAHKLSSGTRIEKLYADHSNRLKRLANQARLDGINTPKMKWSPSAKKAYAKEVASLNDKYTRAVANRPRERAAQLAGNALVRMRMDANPNLTKDQIKKIKNSALNEARARVGAKVPKIEITDDEWKAIQAGAVSDSRLSDILDKADSDRIKELATPKRKVLMTPTKTLRAQTMLAGGYTRAQVAAALGVSVSTLDRALA